MCIPPAPPNSINERGEITEAVLAAVWNEQSPLRGPMWDCQGNPVAVIYRGRWTAGSGPDFEGAMLSMGEEPSHLITGSVEIHLRCADWYAHGHDKDPRYDSVILHVVLWPLAARPVTRADGVSVPTLVLADYISLPTPELLERVSPMLPHLGTLSEEPCWQRTQNRPLQWLLDKIDAAGDDRLLGKAAAMEAALDECRSPDQVFYRGMMDSLGYSANREPMRALAAALPVDNLLALPLGDNFEERATLFESVLLGAAGFLPSQRPDQGPLDYTSIQYAEEVEAIWQANAHAAGLEYEPVVSGWSSDRARPANSPPRRLAAAARLLARLLWEPGGMLGPFAGMAETEKPETLVKKWTSMLAVPGEGYWAGHADFGRPLAPDGTGKPEEAALVGGSRAGDMLVNIVLPLLTAYAERNDLPDVREAAMRVYGLHPRLAENRITRAVAEEALGPRKAETINGARRQQGLIHIYRLFCEARRCYECLPPSIRRLAAMAMEAHDLLCSYAPEFLRDSARMAWDQDAAEFARWLSEFNEYCRKKGLISLSRIPLELIPLLQADSSARAPLRLAGFDRILPTQRRIFDLWGAWQQFPPEQPAEHVQFHSTTDTQTELEACAFWCHKKLEQDPGARLLVIAQNLSQLRGEIERAFLRFNPSGASPPFEFSLGVPLGQTPMARSALLLLRWLDGTLSENELDWLFSSGFAATPEESGALQSCMRTLRRRDLQRVEWTLESFLDQHPIFAALPSQWKQRILATRRSLKQSTRRQSPAEWADQVPRLLEPLGWPGPQAQSTVDFQARRRWQQALDTAASLGFDGHRFTWHEFLSELETTTSEILFSAQSTEAPIQIAGTAESAGLTADAIWFLGADEDSWPAVGSTHPFLPRYLQREVAMPHSSHLQDWEFSAAITSRLLASAPEVHFSFARQKEDAESRPSRLILQVARALGPLSSDLIPAPHDPAITAPFHDSSTVRFAFAELRGGSSVLSSQSQCPFKAFATARLAAKDWDPAEAGLSARQRGQILHEVLHSIWSGGHPGIRNQAELKAIKDIPAFVSKHVKTVLASALPTGIQDQMPPMYLELERTRLVRLVTEWLEYEKARVLFTAEETEAERTVTIAGLTMRLRLDRIDRLIDESQLVIDYKTGNVDPKSWDLPRPDDVQLPLYKLFGLEPLQPSLFESYGGPARGGLVFAKVRTGDTCFTGRVADARATISPSLKGNSALVKRRLTAAEEAEWKAAIEQLADEFIHGRADVAPRDYPSTCERCGLQSVCRIQEPENRVQFEEREDTEAGDAEE